MAKAKTNPAEYIVPLEINGLTGRMLHMPAEGKHKSEILFIYGQHSSLERWWGLIQYLHHYGAVTVPDLPGFGGMDSFYKIGQKPTIDNLADYLAAFMKMRYRHKKVVIVGLSFGFVVATRMLQLYPELTNNVELLVSIVGFTHADDFIFTKRRYWFYRILTRTVAQRLPSAFFRYVCLNSVVLKSVYRRTYLAKSKFENTKTAEDYDLQMTVEIWLWQHNDVRTHAFTTAEFLTLNNCQKQINLPVWHIIADADQYFDHHRVEQHMRIVFSDVHIAKSKFANHAPSVVAHENEVSGLVPPELRQVLLHL
jgi:pimeloyl-ACP methyl ester carboxylesterase